MIHPVSRHPTASHGTQGLLGFEVPQHATQGVAEAATGRAQDQPEILGAVPLGVGVWLHQRLGDIDGLIWMINDDILMVLQMV